MYEITKRDEEIDLLKEKADLKDVEIHTLQQKLDNHWQLAEATYKETTKKKDMDYQNMREERLVLTKENENMLRDIEKLSLDLIQKDKQL
mmetsp:Transcript_27749/g.26807  ORF Transcript_27749/g.26807 Transcript_27749/m.26807 type:complete len:90 (+) Transcript_27749:970-1239(+)|eukprot:CAMPEP_0170553738 /NCGR_PEP_ID=MMETSP0211-20121228/11571_1 /TAXON_ID=311385 /ORGANISM="Pseudokeronopsis sp., Strain OXSARD2" /LENGTH=89 /DNA_ID=CAMNT_0010862277 /DNA_START=944 /DNA_END=1213 /DNA_ORIENTATION=+